MNENCELVTRDQFRKITHAGRNIISKLTRTDFKKAMVNNRINLKHPIIVEYLAKRAACASSKIKRKAVTSNFAGDKKLQEMGGEIENFMDLTVREIVDIFGTDYQFSEWVKAVKGIEDIREKRLKNEAAAGNLISREFVKTHLFYLIDTMNARLLNDSPRTITARILEAHESGMEKEQIEKLVCELISVQLKGVKLRTRRKINAA